MRCADWPAVAAAIKSMVVRGAPAIGITAAYGVVLADLLLPSEAPADMRHKVVLLVLPYITLGTEGLSNWFARVWRGSRAPRLNEAEATAG